jgi:putative DNA primase/helicase
LPTAAKAVGGLEDPDNVGDFLFTGIADVVKAFAGLGEKLSVPDDMMDKLAERQVRVKMTADGRIAIEVDKEDGDKMPGWLLKIVGRKNVKNPCKKWSLLTDVAYHTRYLSHEIFEEAPRENKPTIVIGPDVPRIVRESITALSNDTSLFQRGALVQVNLPLVLPESFGVKRGAASLSKLPPPIIMMKLCENAYFQEVDKLGQLVDCRPDRDTVNVLDAMTSFPGIRSITGVVSTPMLRPNGTIACTPGYDAETGLYFDIEGEYPPPMPVKEAADLLRDVFRDFCFKTERDRAAAVVALLSLFARQSHKGCCPFFLVDGNLSGIGKSLLTDAIVTIFQGSGASHSTLPTNEEEFRKSITTHLLAGSTFIIYDNLTGTIRSGVLEAAMTAEVHSDRVLGGNQLANLPMKVVFFGTGNNATFDSDMIRRTVVCKLETDDERPDLRTGFRHPNLLGFVGEGDYVEKVDGVDVPKQGIRRQLVMACLSILSEYHKQGCPKTGNPKLEDMKPWDTAFAGWSELVRSAAIWAGFEDCDSRDQMHANANEDVDDLDALIEALEEIGRPVTVAEAIDLSQKQLVGADGKYSMDEDRLPIVGAPKLAALLKHIDDRKRGNYLGQLLKRLSNKPRKKRKIILDDSRSRKEWLIVPITDAGKKGGAA